MTGYTVRPLHDRSWLNPDARVPTRFRASWSDTLSLLYFEVDALDGRDLVLEADVTEADLRLDGTIRTRARAASPGVAISFSTTDHGPLMYRCDRYFAQSYGQPDDWQQNVRAVALTLEALRAVDRYGATRSGEQYAGWRQIEATPVVPADPWQVLCDLAGAGIDDNRDRIIRRARRNAHPDTGGSTCAWLRFTAAHERIKGML